MELQNCRENEQAEGLRDLIADLPEGITMAEVGCYRGESTLMFMQSGKVKKLYAIDTWPPGQFEIAEREFNEKLAGYNVVKLKMTMEEAVKYLPKLDFIYIDADHSYEWVTKDIIASLKVIKLGGLIGGHDYADNYSTRVVKAVNQILRLPDKLYKDTSWIKVIKRKKILVVAFAFNEIKYISSMVRYYRRQGCDLFILDNYSDDGTYEWLIKNKIKTRRFDTDGAFHLEKLQKELLKEIVIINPDWVVYSGIDIRYFFAETIRKTIEKADREGYNMISIDYFNMFNTGEKRRVLLKDNYFYGTQMERLYMIAKYTDGFSFEADSIQIPEPKIYDAEGVLINYGACKPKEEREVTYARRRKAWEQGMYDGWGTHYKGGSDKGWIWEKSELTDIRTTEYYKYIKK